MKADYMQLSKEHNHQIITRVTPNTGIKRNSPFLSAWARPTLQVLNRGVVRTASVYRRNRGGVDLRFFPYCPHWLQIIRLIKENVKRFWDGSGRAGMLCVDKKDNDRNICLWSDDETDTMWQNGHIGTLWILEVLNAVYL